MYGSRCKTIETGIILSITFIHIRKRSLIKQQQVQILGRVLWIDKKSFRCAKIRDLFLFHKNYNHLVYQYDYTYFYSLGHRYIFLRYPYFVCLWNWLLSTKIKVYQNKRYWNKKQSFIHSHWYVFDNWSAYITLWKEFGKIVGKIEILMFYSLSIQSILYLKLLKNQWVNSLLIK